MSDNDKDQRHANDHDQDQDHDTGHRHGDDQEHHAAPRRVADAERKDSGVAQDVESVKFGAEPHGKGARITIGPSVAAAGDEQAAYKRGMKGYIRLDKNHMIAKFTITDVKREGLGGNAITAHAIVDVPASELDRMKQPGLTAIINPTSYPPLAPKPQHNVKARVMAYKRDEETGEDYRWLLMAPVGLANGVRVGMNADALDDSGNKIASLVVKTVEEGQCWLALHGDKDSTVKTKGVVINPSAEK
jgi:hypothetical protein